jgi:hypothetical protein
LTTEHPRRRRPTYSVAFQPKVSAAREQQRQQQREREFRAREIRDEFRAAAGRHRGRPVSLFCSYEEGMWPREALPDNRGFLSLCWDNLQATAHHEAGHAVVSDALGHGCNRIELIEGRPESKTVEISGAAYPAIEAHRRVKREQMNLLEGRPFDLRMLIISGIVSAAGPAAERKFCLEEDTPLGSSG